MDKDTVDQQELMRVYTTLRSTAQHAFKCLQNTCQVHTIFGFETGFEN